jgi:hypothetical protein
VSEQEQTIEFFQIPVSLELRKSQDGGTKRMVRGFASMEKMDQQGEIILQNGIDFGPLMKSGYLNYDHQKVTSISGVQMPTIVGYPTHVEMRDHGLWVEGELLKSDDDNPQSEQVKMANELWELGLALAKSGGKRSLAYSVEGNVVERKGNKIVKSIVRHLAITHKPVLAEATIEVFMKSFCCGKCSPLHPLHIPGHTCGDHMHKSEGAAMSTTSAAPLMLQNLDRGMTNVLYGDTSCGCCDANGKFKKGMAGALVHMSECLGHDKAQSAAFMRGLIKGATKRPDIMALVKQSGIAG